MDNNIVLLVIGLSFTLVGVLGLLVSLGVNVYNKMRRGYRSYNMTDDELKRAVGYYTGEYLEGEDWLWAYAPREDYRNVYKGLVGKT